MRWHSKKINYDILIPKLGKHIYQLNETEAASYFKWFVENIPKRTNYISCVCATELGISNEKMDFTPGSLVLLWKWFLKRAKTEVVITENGGTKNFLDSIRTNKRQLTLETEYIIRDIGMYLGETFRRNNSNIYWTYYTKPRRDFFVNSPLLKGFVDNTFGKPFDACFEPVHMTHIQAIKILKGTAKNTDLFDLYHLWANKTGDGLREPF